MGGVNTNYINSVTTQPMAAVASGHGCPHLLFVVYLIDRSNVHHMISLLYANFMLRVRSNGSERYVGLSVCPVARKSFQRCHCGGVPDACLF